MKFIQKFHIFFHYLTFHYYFLLYNLINLLLNNIYKKLFNYNIYRIDLFVYKIKFQKIILLIILNKNIKKIIIILSL